MPFMPVTSRMAKLRAERRKTLQAYEVKALGSQYEKAQRETRARFESEQRGLLSEYQQRVAGYSQQLGQYEQTLRDYEARAGQYQAKADEYNRKVEAFNQLTPLSGRFFAAPNKDIGPSALAFSPTSKKREDYLKELARDYGPDSPLGRALAPYRYAVANKDANVTLIDSSKLPNIFTLKEIDRTKSGSPVFQIYQRGAPDPGEFTEAFPEAPTAAPPSAPTPVDTSGLVSKYTESLNKERDVYEREIGERRLASQRARRRLGERPLLTEG